MAPPMGEISSINHSDGDSQGLTRIQPRIHCAATPDTDEEYSEGDLIIVENFLKTLAEIAMAVAIRNAKRHDEKA